MNEFPPAVSETAPQVGPAAEPADHRIFEISQLLIKVTLGLIWLVVMVKPLVHHDVWHEMALVREALAAGRFPARDLFSYAGTGIAAIHYEWGAGALALAAGRLAGAPGLLILNLLVAGGVAIAGVLLLRGVALPVAALAAALVMLPLSSGLYPVTAMGYSNLLFGLLLWFLARDRYGNRSWIPWFLALFALWVNLHGGLVIAMGAVAITAMERMLRRERWLHLAVVFGGMVLLLAVNPNGTDFYSYLVRTLTMPRTAITEWRPFGLVTSLSAYAVIFGVTLTVTAYTLVRRGPKAIPGILLVVALAVLSLRAQKNFQMYVLAWLAAVPYPFQQTVAGCRLVSLFRRYPAIPGLACGVLIPGLLVASCVRDWIEVPANVYPAGAVSYLRQTGFRGNVMTEFGTGAYVAWSLYPAVKVGCDSRYDLVYTDEWVTANIRFYNTGDQAAYQRLFGAPGTDLTMIGKRSRKAAELLVQRGWSKVYGDAEFQLYARPGLSMPVVDAGGRKIAGTFP